MIRMVCCAGCGDWIAQRNAAMTVGGAWQCRGCHAIDTVIAADPRRTCAWCRAFPGRCRTHPVTEGSREA